MANRDNPHGLTPIMRTLGGGEVAVRQMKKAVGLDTAMCIGDAVARVADGSITSKAADITPGTTLYSGVALTPGAASTATEHLVVISPDAVFEAQASDAGLVEADMGLNANLVLTAPTAGRDISNHEIDADTEDTTNTLDVHLLEKLDTPDNAYGANVRVEIVFNKHRMAAASVAGV